MEPFTISPDLEEAVPPEELFDFSSSDVGPAIDSPAEAEDDGAIKIIVGFS